MGVVPRIITSINRLSRFSANLPLVGEEIGETDDSYGFHNFQKRCSGKMWGKNGDFRTILGVSGSLREDEFAIKNIFREIWKTEGADKNL